MAVTIRNGITPNIDSTTGIASSTGAAANPGFAFGTYHMADSPNFYEPQRTNNFEFVVTDLDGIIRAGMEGTEADIVRVIKNAQEVLRLAIARSFIPTFTQGVIEVQRGNTTLKYAGVPKFNSGNVVINDYIGSDGKQVLEAWRALSYNVKTEKVGLASQYKKDAYLIQYSPDMQPVTTYRLHGCWISNLAFGDMDAENNNKMQVTATIEYDRGEIDNTSLEG